jgi:hypothetical protein
MTFISIHNNPNPQKVPEISKKFKAKNIVEEITICRKSRHQTDRMGEVRQLG